MTHILTILGANSAIPAYDRHPTCQYLQMDEDHFIIDCGEGSQINIAKYKLKKSKVSAIFISHLHGDHIYGLPGLISSMSLSGRQKPLSIFGPKGLQEYIDLHKKISRGFHSFKLEITELDHNGSAEIFCSKFTSVKAFPLKHRISTYGYRFDEKQKPRNINKDVIQKYSLTVDEIVGIKSGMPIFRNGIELLKQKLFLKEKPVRSYSYCSDTQYDENIIPHIQKSSTLYHEATYLHDLVHLAKDRMHSTAKQAAQIASLADVSQLIIGHYSTRYPNLYPLLKEAKQVFQETRLAIEGQQYEIG